MTAGERRAAMKRYLLRHETPDGRVTTHGEFYTVPAARVAAADITAEGCVQIIRPLDDVTGGYVVSYHYDIRNSDSPKTCKLDA